MATQEFIDNLHERNREIRLEDCIQFSHISDERKASLTDALEKIWQTDAGKKIILDAYAHNNNEPVSIVNAKTGYNYVDSAGNSQSIETSNRTVNTPGKAEISLDFENPRAFMSEGKSYLVSDERLLRHELYHIAYENDDLAQKMRPHVNEYISNNGGLHEEHFIKLHDMGVLNDKQVSALEAMDAPVNLQMVEEMGKPLTTEQLNSFTEHFLAPHTDNIRHAMNAVEISGAHVNSLIDWGITVSEGHELLESIAEGEKITFADVEQKFGKLDFIALTINASKPEFLLQMSDAQRIQIRSDIEPFIPLGTEWMREQGRHEEMTVDITDQALDGPDRTEYGNAHFATPESIKL